MTSTLISIVAAAGLFAGTNIDDMVVLAMLNASSNADGRPRRWQICAGQYLGVGILTATSIAVALGLTFVPERWVWPPGWIPIGLGVRKLVIAIRSHAARQHVLPVVATGLLRGNRHHAGAPLRMSRAEVHGSNPCCDAARPPIRER